MPAASAGDDGGTGTASFVEGAHEAEGAPVAVNKDELDALIGIVAEDAREVNEGDVSAKMAEGVEGDEGAGDGDVTECAHEVAEGVGVDDGGTTL